MKNNTALTVKYFVYNILVHEVLDRDPIGQELVISSDYQIFSRKRKEDQFIESAALKQYLNFKFPEENIFKEIGKIIKDDLPDKEYSSTRIKIVSNKKEIKKSKLERLVIKNKSQNGYKIFDTSGLNGVMYSTRELTLSELVKITSEVRDVLRGQK